MPPKKRNRQPASEDLHEDTSRPSTRSKSEDADPWTDEQEGLLLKNMISLKPVGMHKYFRVMAISEMFRRNGFSTNRDVHLQPEGIWRKLKSLYNLANLDDVENLASLSLHKNEPADQAPFCDFELGIEDYGELIFAQRVDKSDRPTSPSLLSYQLASDGSLARTRRRQSTIDDTDEPRSSPASTRGGRGSRARGKRTSRIAEAARHGQRGKPRSPEDSAEDDDEDTAETASIDYGSASKNKRRSGRNR